MFNLQGSEIIFILLLALVVLGPEKLPGAIRSFAKTYAELRKMGTGFQQEVKSAFDEPMREVRETADLIKQQTDVDMLEAEHAASEALDESARAERAADGPAIGDADGATGDPVDASGRAHAATDVAAPDHSGDASPDADDEPGVGPNPLAEGEPPGPQRPYVPAPPPPFSASPPPETTDDAVADDGGGESPDDAERSAGVTAGASDGEPAPRDEGESS